MPYATDATSKSLLTDVLSARVPPGFSDQIRAAARAEGVRPGALIRQAISERIERVGDSACTRLEGLTAAYRQPDQGRA